LKDAGADMSHVSISRSYAVLVGLEAYVRSRRRGKKLVQKLIHGRDRLLSPEEVAKREEEERDKCESAEREKRFLEMKQEADQDQDRANAKLLKKLHITHGSTDDTFEKQEVVEKTKDKNIQVPGTGPENAIAPEGTRNP
jgi:hypothetical protein